MLYDFALSLIRESYDALMRSLKGKFLREVEDIVALDHMRFLNLAGFLMSIHRLTEEDRIAALPSAQRAFDAGPVAQTLDVWSFSFVVKCCDSWMETKNTSGLVCASVLLKEMVQVGSGHGACVRTVCNTCGTWLCTRSRSCHARRVTDIVRHGAVRRRRHQGTGRFYQEECVLRTRHSRCTWRLQVAASVSTVALLTHRGP